MVDIKEGDFVVYDGSRKKVFGIHTNDNIILKINGTLVQIFRDKITKN